ncbi:MAG: hypothetical protein A2086_11495 [Spirochaetes bacterium GWD1_27_9]|nr:MAG: hypothetical protein A2Y34_14275 [Spirochaetes bacterium GWC1_27_15]OHD36552.1 MAG: hypothetical protein A2086_11495 [Spirochaetes bacterium GWD1_27_9]
MAVLKIDTNKIVENFNKIQKLSKQKNLELVAVTKLFLSENKIVDLLIKNGASVIGDCYYENLKKIPQNVKRMLLMTRLSDIKKDFSCCDIAFLSELKMIEEISKLKNSNKIDIILAIDLGDLREGILPKNLINFMEKALKFKNINIIGIGANLGCLIGKLWDDKMADILLEASNSVKNKLKFEFQKISVGGTVVYDNIFKNDIPKEINQVRIGEAIFFGYNMSLQKKIDGLNQNPFVISGEILEIIEKDSSLPDNLGFTAFGKKSEPCKLGLRKRAILDFGELVAPISTINPCDEKIKIMGATHNHIVIDITDDEANFGIGDFVDFHSNYNGIAYTMLSPFVKRIYI